MKYVHQLQKFIGVDIYGECGPHKCGHTRSMSHKYSIKKDPCFDMVNQKYKFYLSFENALCSDYVTEKMFNALKLNTIPVVFGGANYSAILPPHSYIDALEYPDPKGQLVRFTKSFAPFVKFILRLGNLSLLSSP